MAFFKDSGVDNLGPVRCDGTGNLDGSWCGTLRMNDNFLGRELRR